ncbi:MAG: hypothetical protein DLM68_11840 [Hyphomicrobiales bacterium]|nr:MAG: hypothetical protein DLM68_11840 [Hyphomicrobiales bacterium]
MGYPVPAGEVERCQGERRDDYDDAQTKHRTKIEAKKTFAGLTRPWPLSKSATIPRRHRRLHSSCFNAA